MKDLTGKTIGPYQVILKIQETPTKAVYKAFDTQLGSTVALEVILPGQEKPKGLFVALKEHSKALEFLSHPNIPKILNCKEYKKEICLVFDFIPSRILRRRFGNRMNWREAASTLIPVCQSLIYAHDQGVIHGNIAIGNILIDQNGQATLFDFGIDLLIKQELLKEAPGKWIGIGVSGSSAPEQVIGKNIDQRADIYSIGMVYYELVTGKKAYQGNSSMDELANQFSQHLPSPIKLVKSLPESVSKLLDKALAKNPADRFGDMQIFTTLLSKIALDIPITKNEFKNNQSGKNRSNILWLRISVILLAFLSIALIYIFQLSPIISKKAEPTSSSSVALQTLPISKPIISPTPFMKITATPIQKTAPPISSPQSFTPIYESIPALSGESLPTISGILNPLNLQKVIQLGKWGIGRVNNATWSSDNHLLALATSLGVFIYDAQTFELQKYLNPGAPVRCVSFSHDNQTLATGEENGLIHIWNISDGSQKSNLSGHLKGINSIKFSPDDSILASGSDDQTIRLWNIGTEKTIYVLKKHTREVKSLDFSPDGILLVSGAPDFSVKIWEVSTGNLKSENSQTSMITQVAFSEDGKAVYAGGSNGLIESWSVDNGARVQGYTGLITPVSSISVSKETGYLSAGDTSGVIVTWKKSGEQLWKTKNQRLARILEPGFQYSNIVFFSPDSKSVYSAIWDGTIRYLNTQTGKEDKLIDSISDFVTQIAVSHDSHYLATQTSDGMVTVWDLYKGKKLYRWSGYLVLGNVFSEDNKYLALRVDPNTARVYDLVSGTELWTFHGHTDIRGIAFSPDNRSLAVGNKNEIKVWSIFSGQEFITSRSSNMNGCSSANSLAYATHSNLVTYSIDACKFQKGGWMQTLGYSKSFTQVAAGGISKLEFNGKDMQGLTGYVVGKIAISSDSRLVAASLDDLSIRIWVTSSGKELMRLFGHDRQITDLTFTNDDNLLISSSLDGTVQFWGIH